MIDLYTQTRLTIPAVVNGYGKHKADLTKAEFIQAFKVCQQPLTKQSSHQQWFYGAQITYKIAVALYKLSMLFLYLRIFTGSRFKVLTYTLIGIVTASGCAFVLVTIWQCKPIAAFWDKSLLLNKNNHCFSSEAFWFSYSIVNIVLDFLVLLLPIHEIWKLQLPKRDKLALCAVFSLGLLYDYHSHLSTVTNTASVCATTIIRTTTLAASASSKDPTWGIIPATIWSVVEANTGTICACLPTLKQPLSYLFPSIFNSTDKSSPGFFDRTPPDEIYRLERGKKGSGQNKEPKRLDLYTWGSVKGEDDTISTSHTIQRSNEDKHIPIQPAYPKTAPSILNVEIGQAMTTPGILRTVDLDVQYKSSTSPSPPPIPQSQSQPRTPSRPTTPSNNTNIGLSHTRSFSHPSNSPRGHTTTHSYGGNGSGSDSSGEMVAPGVVMRGEGLNHGHGHERKTSDAQSFHLPRGR